ncbi:MAG: UDP-N-acetylmuramate dehydrogenase [Veillonellaceae bacterium]|nr:UDP-N-acetylmuramate dehydrogenase [Veillonellaceae bacterium]
MNRKYWEKLFGGIVPLSNLHFEEPMARHTTFAIGGPADLYIEPETEAELAGVLRVATAEDLPVSVLGGGANVLVRDGGIRGLTIGLSRLVRPLYVEGTTLIAAGGVRLTQVSRKAAAAGLTGLEFACGIPGTIGGAVWMNAGAYGGEMCQIVTGVTALTPAGERVEYDREELAFGYRKSRFQETGDIVTEVRLALQEGESEAIRQAMAQYNEQRRHKQPLDHPSAGSTFKRPPGNYAGTLIDRTGLKGLAVGGAAVSTLHAGFIVNRGGATAKDVLTLIAEIRRRVYDAHGVDLEPEVRIFGEDLQETEGGA